MTNGDLAEKIYEDLKKKGAGIGNASIGIIRKTLDDNGVGKRSTPIVAEQSERLCSNLDKNYNCKNMCLTRCIDGNKFWK